MLQSPSKTNQKKSLSEEESGGGGTAIPAIKVKPES